MPNFDTDYKFNPRVREIIEARRGAKMGLTHAQSELLVRDVLLGKYKGDYKFKSEDKTKIMFNLVDFNPTQFEKEHLDELAKFLLNVLDKNEVIDFVTKVTNRQYHPGMVIYQVRVYNSLVTYFISLFSGYLPMYQGIIINTKFLGDVKKICPDVMYNEESGEIEDGTVNEKIGQFVDNLKKLHKRKLKVCHKDDVIILASKDVSVINNLSTYNLSVEDIPEFYFKWENNGLISMLG
jgi:hypothetical protein